MQKYFNITKETNIYVYCPSGVVTGGAELLHQLVDIINRHNGRAHIVYYGNNPHVIPDDYKKYIIKLAEQVIDAPENIIIIFEGIVEKIFDIKQAQILLWWLSVDNFFYCQKTYLSFFDLLKFNKAIALEQEKGRIRHFLKNLLTFNFKEKELRFSLKALAKNKNILCSAYQSEYANDFLLRNKFTNIYPLKDYINEEYEYNSSFSDQKNDYILYNPKKGLNFTEKLIKESSDLQWIPIKNMTRNEVKAIMLKSKLYIDFGYHPGKDRLPREAAMCGCCIITGKKGSAGFFSDISINERKYKFDQKKRNIPIILEKIRFILNNYEQTISDFSEYRNIISREKDEFEKQTIYLLT